MNLLAKTNPTATRETVIRHAIIFGGISTIGCLAYLLWKCPTQPVWLLLAPAAGVTGAALGALLEWQLDDGVEIYWIVLEVQDEFGVKIVNWEDIATAGDLYQYTLAGLRESQMDADDDEVWQRLNALLMKQLRLKPEQILPESRFYVDINL